MQGVKVEIWGDYALFTRPETKVERFSYDVMTPSAARGILEAIFWKPAIRWKIDKIHVLSPIRTTNIRRNEVSSKILASNVRTVMGGGDQPLFISTTADIQQRAACVLKDVRYVIEAHFELTDKAGQTDSEEKFYAIACRRLQKGQFYHQPYLGCREFPAHFRPYADQTIPTAYADEVRELGLMLYDMDYTDPNNIHPTFFRAVLDHGTLHVADCEVFR